MAGKSILVVGKFLQERIQCLVVGLTVTAGVIHGRLSHRWGPRQDMLAAAQRLQAVPNEFGNWRLRNSRPFPSGFRSSAGRGASRRF